MQNEKTGTQRANETRSRFSDSGEENPRFLARETARRRRRNASDLADKSMSGARIFMTALFLITSHTRRYPCSIIAVADAIKKFTGLFWRDV